MEVEIKIPISKERYEAEAAMNSVSLFIKQDLYFSKYNNKEERMKNNEHLIRIRKETRLNKEDAYFTLKIKDFKNGVEYNLEQETYVSEPLVIESFLKNDGYKVWFDKKKTGCEVFQSMNGIPFHIEYECVNDKFYYVEIENTSNAEFDDIVSAMKSLTSMLGLNYNDNDPRNWVEILSNSDKS